jgi:hypothetical protein
MSFYSCENPRDHQREGEDDFRNHGRYGFDLEKYYDRHSDDCAAAYMDGFNRAVRGDEDRREDEARQEQYQRGMAAMERPIEEFAESDDSIRWLES